MNYYKRHLGDYARKAGHLSMLEHGAYNLILDAYYDREVAPTRAEAVRYARARTPAEIAAVETVLAEFFNEREDGRFYQSRVEDEFIEAAAQADKNRENGKRGGRPRKQLGTQTEPKKTQSVISGNPDESQTKGNPLIHKSTNPEQEQKHVQRAAARFAEFWALYPVKKGKAAAERAWKAKRCDELADEILAHVLLMQTHDDDWIRGYVPHGSTYVNGERWNDEPKGATTARAGPGQQQMGKTAQALLALEELSNGGMDQAGNFGGVQAADVLGPGAYPGGGGYPAHGGRLVGGPD